MLAFMVYMPPRCFLSISLLVYPIKPSALLLRYLHLMGVALVSPIQRWKNECCSQNMRPFLARWPAKGTVTHAPYNSMSSHELAPSSRFLGFCYLPRYSVTWLHTLVSRILHQSYILASSYWHLSGFSYLALHSADRHGCQGYHLTGCSRPYLRLQWSPRLSYTWISKWN